MNAATKYQLLHRMDISYWLDRSAVLKSNAPLFCARCLVLLPETITPPTPEEDKILTGMINVLGLQKNEIGIAWVQNFFSVAILKAELLKWAPKSILIMGEVFAKTVLESTACLEDSVIIQVTYHPQHLQSSPTDKKKAYRDLLFLKQALVERKAL